MRRSGGVKGLRSPPCPPGTRAATPGVARCAARSATLTADGKEVGLKERFQVDQERVVGDPPRKTYQTPLLRCHGSVRLLTLGGGATSVDGVNTTMMAN